MNHRLLAASTALLFVVAVSATADAAPSNWTCDEAAFGDGVCDCGCGADDSDCEAGERFIVCETSACATGTVPWEHSPASCMTSACGDGWVDEGAGEVCDDLDALDSGGCNADCTEVNEGYTCGVRAEGCEVAAVEEPEPDAGPSPDAGSPDAASTDTATEPGTDTPSTSSTTDDDSGCAAAPGAPVSGSLWLMVLGAVVGWRRRSHQAAA